MNTELITAPNILTLFDTTKEQRGSFVADLVQRIDDGEIDALKVHSQVKSMEDIIDRLTSDKGKSPELAKRYKVLLLDAANNYGKSFELHNAKFETKEVGTKYNFDQCGDSELLSAYLERERLDAKIKAREAFLKTVAIEGMDIRVGDELITVYPPAKSSTTSIAVTLK